MKISQIGLLLLLGIIFLTSCSPPEQKTGVNGNEIALTNGIEKGQIPPDFTIKTIDGKPIALSQFKNENKPVLLYFWASWCPYCKQDLSIVKEVYPNYADRVKFVAIDLDVYESADKIRKYSENMGLAGIDFTEADTKVLGDYAITHTTTKYAIGKSGTIIYKGSGVFTKEQWEILFDGLISS